MVADVYQPFPVDVLPEPLRSFTKNTAAAMGCDPAMVAVPLLVALAAAVGTTRRVEIKPGYLEVCVLWAMIVAMRGGKKSPAMKRALRAVHQMQARIYGFVSSTVAEPDDSDDDSPRAGSRRTANRSTPDHTRRLLTTDVSVAGLAQILQKESRGILVFRDELAGWFADLHKRPGRSDVSQWLSAWSAELWIIDRKGSEPTYIPEAAVSVIGGIQPEVLPRVITATDMQAGLFDRFLFVVPPPPPVDRLTKLCEDPEDNRMIDIVFRQLYGIGDQRDLHLDPDAGQLNEEFYNRLSQTMSESDANMATILSKYRSYGPRLALTGQCLCSRMIWPALHSWYRQAWPSGSRDRCGSSGSAASQS